MPQFYFHLYDGGDEAVLRDDSGLKFPDVESARAEAVEAAKEIVIEAIKSGHNLDGQHFSVTCDGAVVAVVNFCEIVKILPPGNPAD
jgi:hypothetical protein